MKRAALYVRVSTEEQKKHGISIDSQIDALKEYCRQNGYAIAGVYNDAGISARKSYRKRPALLKLIEDCKFGSIDVILFTKLDRWFRSVGDYYEVQSILDSCKVPWKCIWEDYETITSSGIFKVNIMLSVAQSEADRTSERIKSTQAYKLSKGEYIGGNKAPIGYVRNGKQYDIDEDTQEAVSAFFSAYLASFSQQQAITAAAENGLKLNSCQAQRILYHPAYYGGLNFCPHTYITPAEHERIEKAKRKTKNFATGYQYIFSGLLVCSLCGKHMVANRTVRPRKDGSLGHSVRYVCPSHEKGYGCDGSSVSEKFLEGYLISSFDSLLADYNFSISSSASANIEKAIAQKESRLKRLRDLYELGDIPFNEYKDKRIALLADIEELKKEPTEKMRDVPSDWLSVYNQLDVPHRRSFWLNSLGYIEISGMRCTSPIVHF